MPLSRSTSPDTFIFETEHPRTRSLPATLPPERDHARLGPQIAIASIAAHLIFIACLGGGVPAPRRSAPAVVVPPPTVATVEHVQLTPPTPPVAPPPDRKPIPTPDLPPNAPDLALPPLPALAPLAAVPSSVPVAFGIEVKGPVRLVANAGDASGAVGGRALAEPLALDAANEHDLVLPVLRYPPRARQLHLTGTVVLEFHTSPTGDIFDVKLRSSSGHELLDEAARQNLEAGRWRGRPGFFLKAFEFSLQ